MNNAAEVDEELAQQPAKILVIDSDNGSRALLKRRLSIYGHEVITSDSADGALKLLNERSIDAIFLNMELKGSSGYDFLLTLKENSKFKSIPVIMISSDSDIEMVVKCLEAGAEDYLVKPLNQTFLKARLSNCIAKKEAHDKELAYLAKIEQGQKQIVAQEKMASIGVLVSSISQELKNPLNFVINFASVSSDICNDMQKIIDNKKENISSDLYDILSSYIKTFQSNVAKISEYGQTADRIIRFMIDQSSASGGKKHPGSVNKVITQTITMLLSSYKNNGITVLPQIKTEFDENIPHVDIVIQSLSKAIYNLLNNAIQSVISKFEDISLANIIVTTKNEKDFISIAIYDNGIGINEEILPKIFQPFFTTKTDGVSTGLGLSTAKEVAEDHGGDIMVLSEKNNFAKFTLNVKKN